MKPFGVRISHALFPILLGACFIGGCHDDEDEEILIEEETLFETTLTVTRLEGHAAPSFGVGEPIKFTLAVRNLTDREITLNISSPGFVVHVFDAGTDRLIWESNRGLVFPAVVSYLTFLPGETKTFTRVWDADDVTGIPLPGVGIYDAQGYLGGPWALPHLRSKRVVFIVELR